MTDENKVMKNDTDRKEKSHQAKRKPQRQRLSSLLSSGSSEESV